jgi:hypothetical protein
MTKKGKKARPKPQPITSVSKRRSTYLRWKRWLQHVYDEIVEMALDRYVYREVRAMIAANTNLQVPSVFYDWMNRAYVADMAVAIRRQTDKDTRSMSLLRLIQDVMDHPEIISRRRFVGLYGSGRMRTLGHRDFERFAKKGTDQINPAVIRKHERELLAAERKLRRFVNKHVAHRSRFPMRHLPTYGDLDTCLDLLERLLKDYKLLLEADGLSRVVPVIQYDWMKPFRVAWTH